MGYGFFLIHKITDENKNRLLTARLWKLGEYPILIRMWTPNFLAEAEAKEYYMTIWTNIKFLSFEYHSSEVLNKNGNLLGKTLAPGIELFERAPSTHLLRD